VDFSRRVFRDIASWKHCSPLQQCMALGLCDAVIDFFAVYNATMTHNAFQWAGQTPKLPFLFV